MIVFDTDTKSLIGALTGALRERAETSQHARDLLNAIRGTEWHDDADHVTALLRAVCDSRANLCIVRGEPTIP